MLIEHLLAELHWKLVRNAVYGILRLVLNADNRPLNCSHDFRWVLKHALLQRSKRLNLTHLFIAVPYCLHVLASVASLKSSDSRVQWIIVVNISCFPFFDQPGAEKWFGSDTTVTNLVSMVVAFSVIDHWVCQLSRRAERVSRCCESSSFVTEYWLNKLLI